MTRILSGEGKKRHLVGLVDLIVKCKNCESQRVPRGRSSLVVMITDSWMACHEFDSRATEDLPCRRADASSLLRLRVLSLVWYGSSERVPAQGSSSPRDYSSKLRVPSPIALVLLFTQVIRSNRLRWLGHIWRSPENNQTRAYTFKNPMGSRTRGRPPTRWIDDVENDLKTLNIKNWQRVAAYRWNWKKRAVEAAKTCNRLLPL
ncbi:endonuclease-reverse transcriptase [Trichonephila clavipes]|nr:endonuclease-reverse transcriptase [Trichonephila clavipes]